MLFDIRSGRRRRLIQGIYATLAVLMAGGLIFFGIGGNVSGGLVDGLSGGGGGSSANTFGDRAEELEKQVQARPREARLWAELARAQALDAADEVDADTGAFTEDGSRKATAAARSWARYLALDPPQPSSRVASQMIDTLARLGRYADATRAMEIVVDDRPPSAGIYVQLAQLAYAAGQTRKGDLAGDKALELAPSGQRATVRSTLDAAKKNAESTSTSTTTTP